MAITITEILPDDEVAASLPVINENFSNLKDGVDTIQEMINPTTGELAVNTIYIEKGANAVSTVLETNEGSTSIEGNLSVAGTFSGSQATLTGGATVSGGNINHTNATGKISTAGDLEVFGSTLYKGANTTFLDASDPASYESGNVAGTNAILSITHKNYIMLDFSAYNGVTKNIISVQLPSGTAGQQITLVTKIGASIGNHHLKSTGIAGLSGGNTVSFTQGTIDYRTVTLIWTGAEWVIVSAFNSQIV